MISAAIPGANSDDSDEPSFLMPVDDEKLSVHAAIRSGCGCPNDCYKQFSEEEVYLIHLQMLENEKEV